ncbi:MAG: AbrB/MazE/SpoVT family DNA-binding domain-containing protein [Chloroflexota bacterium]
MFGRVQKWGHSFAVRIPKSLAETLGWNQETQIQETIVDGKLIIEAVPKTNYTLEQLLEGINPDNLHNVVDTGSAVGNEFW